MTEMSATDSRRVLAEHNLEAILDGVETLLHRGEQPSISAVAKAAGVSRPTVYAHFSDRRKLVEALVERTVQRTMRTIEAAEPERGPASEALERLIGASWRELASHDRLAQAASVELSPEAMRTAHESARVAIADLVERGRGDGSFRTDVPTSWLVTASLALIHAAAEEVRAGGLDPDAALHALSLSIFGLFGASEPAPAG